MTAPRDGNDESRLERRLWIIGGAVIYLLIAAGATRQLMKLFG
jgi:hypothetical protein